jgi:hypothetical protein
MAQATTDRVRLAYVPEVTFKTTPASPLFRLWRNKSQGLGGTPKSVVSEEIISSREIADFILVGKDVAGDVGGELIHDAYEEQMAGAYANAWVGGPRRWNAFAGQITAVSSSQYTVLAVTGEAFAEGMLVRATGFTNAGNNRIFRAAATSSGTAVVVSGGTTEASPPVTARLQVIGFAGASGDVTATTTGLASTVLDLTTLGLTVGQWLYAPGTADAFGTAAGNKFAGIPGGFLRISAIAAAAITCDIRPAGWTTDAGASKTIHVYGGKFLKNGTTRTSFTIERAFLDTDAVTYEYFTGSIMDKMSVSAKPQAIMEIGFSVLSAVHTLTETEASGATRTTISSDDVMNTSSNVVELMEGGSSILAGPNFVLGMDFQINNNVRQGPGIGTLNYVVVNLGTFEVSGKVETYFASKALLDKLLSQSETQLMQAVIDGDHHGLLFDFPNVKYGSGSPAVPGRNEDVKVTLDFRAKRDPTLLYTASVTQFESIGS